MVSGSGFRVFVTLTTPQREAAELVLGTLLLLLLPPCFPPLPPPVADMAGAMCCEHSFWLCRRGTGL